MVVLDINDVDRFTSEVLEKHFHNFRAKNTQLRLVVFGLDIGYNFTPPPYVLLYTPNPTNSQNNSGKNTYKLSIVWKFWISVNDALRKIYGYINTYNQNHPNPINVGRIHTANTSADVAIATDVIGRNELGNQLDHGGFAAMTSELRPDDVVAKRPS
jgi:hypothetical protein